MRIVYLDNNATTPVLPAVFDAMRPFLTEHFGNPSSAHRMGDKPASAVRDARAQVAALIGCTDAELTFTSCGTESNNLAIRGVMEMSPNKRHLVTTSVEHSAVLNPAKRWQSLGYEVTFLPVDRAGRLDLDQLRDAIRDDTALVSVMFANNETGVIFPLDRIAEIVHKRGVPLLVDAVQGVGALFSRKGTRWAPVFLGGSQERGRRPGTENVAGIVGMGAAAAAAETHLADYHTQVRALRDRFEKELLARVPDTFVNGIASERLPNTSNIGFHAVDANAMLVLLDEVGICVSAGSACKSGAGLPSHVLGAMGLSPEEAASCLRFSLSSLTTAEDIDACIEHIPGIVERMRRNFISA
jgi:cysteine desulfurase